MATKSKAKNETIYDKISGCESIGRVLGVLKGRGVDFDELCCEWADIDKPLNVLADLSEKLSWGDVDEVTTALTDANENGVDWSGEWVASIWDEDKDRLVYVNLTEDDLPAVIKQVNSRLAIINDDIPLW